MDLVRGNIGMCLLSFRFLKRGKNMCVNLSELRLVKGEYYFIERIEYFDKCCLKM